MGVALCRLVPLTPTLRKDAESRLSLTEICSGASSNLEREELLESRIHELEAKVVETVPGL